MVVVVVVKRVTLVLVVSRTVECIVLVFCGGTWCECFRR